MATQEFRIQSDSPINDELMFWGIVGHEGLSRPAAYELSVLSKANDLDASDVLGHAFDVVVEFVDPGGNLHERHCQGHAVRFARMGAVGRYFEYRITLRSWFWLLTKRINARIHQDRSVLEVMDATFEDSAIKRFKKTKPSGVVGEHKPRTYCVQFEESDYAFVSRLLEDEGIYYWFDAHDAPGTMLLADGAGDAHDKLPVVAELPMATGGGEERFDEILRWCDARSLTSGRYASRDSDFKKIRTVLKSDADASGEHEMSDLEVFEFPGGYFENGALNLKLGARIDQMVSERRQHWALTAWPDVAVGRCFDFSGDPDGTRDGAYLIAGCTMVLMHPGYEGMDMEPREGAAGRLLAALLADDAVNAQVLDPLARLIAEEPLLHTGRRGAGLFLLTALPASTTFKPPRLTPRVRMPGPQSAIVVGAAGKEHDVDPFGRIKVHFHWDRYDQSDEKSTCWIRVSQPWAGKGWGGYFAPRIGQEVVVDFLNGDPDRPLVMGRVYDDDQPIPYPSATQSGFKTRSTPGGGPSNYNELMFEDKKGAELVSIHAERNMSTSVEVDDSLSVGQDQVEGVGRDHTTTVGRNEKNTVAEKQENTVGIRQINSIGSGGQLTQVGGFQENVFHASQKTSVVGDQTLVVTAKQSVAVGGEQKTAVGGEQKISVTGAQTTTVGGNLTINGMANTKIQTTGERNDITTAKHAIMSNQIKMVANATIEMMAVGNINATSIGSNTTVLGSNSSGYIGVNSEANLGIARSTFMGLSMNNALAVDISNFVGAQIENTAAIRLSNVAAAYISQAGVDFDMTTMKTITGGAGGGAGAAPSSVTGVLAGVAVGVVGAAFGVYDVNQTLNQYEQAEKDLDQAAIEAARMGLSNLAGRLDRMARLVNRRRREGTALAVGGPIWLLGEIGAEATGGTYASSASKTLGEESQDSAGRGRPASATAPEAPTVPAMPQMPPPYRPPGQH